MGKGSGRGGDGGSRAEVREFAASFQDVGVALKNERAVTAAKVVDEKRMQVHLVPEPEMAELSKKIFAAAKPYRGKSKFSWSFMYLFRECRAHRPPRALAVSRINRSGLQLSLSNRGALYPQATSSTSSAPTASR
jgi:hypothetical protein